MPENRPHNQMGIQRMMSFDNATEILIVLFRNICFIKPGIKYVAISVPNDLNPVLKPDVPCFLQTAR